MWGLVAAPPIAAVLTIVLAPDPHGHWTGHLSSAYLGIAQFVLLVALAAVLGARSWRSLPRVVSAALLLSVVAIAVGIAYQVVGNVQVARSIWGTRGDPGFGDGYAEGHDRAATGDLLVVIGGVAFACVVGITRRVPRWVAGVALLMVVVPPPWAWPAAGVLLVLLVGLTIGFERAPARSTPPEAAVGGR